ncbi:IspD/TarI family cytidylyltransferase [Enterocloster bolteae]|uniref:IspD/TarI family cytidylyltransferase n=1 Tax=Enterocloster bolteae TaxID=208479 RepID=UPI002A833B95|nr:IspD/TarI family cytidylyltransferase [Enterocloster bolteae]
MNHAIILAGGVGQRMRSSGMPKQFLEVFGKPIIVYTLEKFEFCEGIDKIIIVCNSGWIEHMQDLIRQYSFRKVEKVVAGGKNRQTSLKNGLKYIIDKGGQYEDIIVIHDGVRPLVEMNIIDENIRVAERYGSAMTVKPVIESVVITDKQEAVFTDFKKRDDTYSLTAPQSFKLRNIMTVYNTPEPGRQPFPLLDAALAYTYLGNDIHVVVENNNNLKITTPEDYYIFKAMLELEENKYVFGL